MWSDLAWEKPQKATVKYLNLAGFDDRVKSVILEAFENEASTLP